MGKCCICKKEIDSNTATILFMSGAGIPRCICEECDKNVETMTAGRDPDAIITSCRELAGALERGETGEERVIMLVGEMLGAAKERADKIRAGEYDFSLDEAADEGEEFELTDDMLETEEDRALDEKEARVNKILDTVTSWTMGIALVAAVVFFIIKFVL